MIQRKQIGETVEYRGHQITAHYIGPDLLLHVDGYEVGNFYKDRQAVIVAGKKYIDQVEKESKR